MRPNSRAKYLRAMDGVTPTQVDPASLLGSGSWQNIPMPQVGMQDGGELHAADGGVFKTLRGYFGGQKTATDRRMAAAEGTPQPAPQPQPAPDPRVTATNPAGIQFKTGGELRLHSGGPDTGGHRSPLDGLADLHSFMGEGVEGLSNMLPSMNSFLPAPSQNASPARFERSTLPNGSVLQRQVSYQLPNGSNQPVMPQAAPTQPAPTAQPQVTQSGQPVAMPGYAQRQGFTPSVPAPAPAPAAPSLRDTAPQQPWRTDSRVLHDSSGAVSSVVDEPIYRSGTSFSDQPNAIKKPMPTGTISMKDWSAPGRSTGQPNAQNMDAANNMALRQQPQQYASVGDANDSLSRRTVKMKAGGDLRTGHGGVVPGKGKGDKIPAKYEPGEFVVSNDMLAAKPSLRGELRALRKKVLAAKGMTVAQADAKVVGYGDENLHHSSPVGDGHRGRSVSPDDHHGPHQVSLRALHGADWAALTQRELAKGQDIIDSYSGIRGAEAQGLVRDAEKLIQQPAAEVARGASTAPVDRATPKFTMGPSANLEPSAAGVVRDKLVGSGADWRTAGGKIAAKGESALGTLGTGIRQLGGLAKVAAIPTAAYELYRDFKKPETDYGDVALHGTDAAAGLALLSPAAPAAGLYLGGRALWEGGKALRDYMNKPDAPAQVAQPKAAQPQAAQPQAAAAQPQDANAAMMAKFAAEHPELNANQGPVQLGATRNVDPGSGTMEMYTKGSSDTPGWTTVSTPEAKVQANALRMQYAQDADSNAARSRADTARQLAYFEKQNAGGVDKYSHLPFKVAAQLRAAEMQADATRAGHEVQREGHAVQREGNQLNYDASVLNHKLTRDATLRRLDYEMGKDRRDFNVGRADKAKEQRLAGDKAWDDHASTLFQTVDKESGKPIPDAKRIADYTAATDETIKGMIEALSKSGDPQKIAYAQTLSKNGRSALDDEDRANMTKRFKLMELHRQSYGMTPLSSSGPSTNDLRKYANMRPQAGNVIQQRMEFVDEAGNPTGASVPNVNLEYGPDANHFFPNWGQQNNSLR